MNFREAKAVLAKTPGAKLTRSPDGNGFVVIDKRGNIISAANSRPTAPPKSAPKNVVAKPSLVKHEATAVTSRSKTHSPKQHLNNTSREDNEKSRRSSYTPASKATKSVTAPKTFASTSKTKNVLDTLAVVLAVSASTLKSHGVDPLIRTAIEATSNTPLSELQSDPEALQGAINAAKGKFFELLVQRDLKNGITYEDIAVEHGGNALLAEKLNQAGWDLQLIDREGETIQELQLKATDSISYIRDTLERYPDISILSTTEVAEKIGSDQVISSGVSNAQLNQDIEQVMTASDASGLAFGDAFDPLIPLLVISVTEGYHLALGEESAENIADRYVSRAGNSLTGTAVGALFLTMGFGWLSVIPAVFAAKEGPEGLVDRFSDMVRGETDQERRARRQQDADSANRLLERRGLKPTYTSKTAPDSEITGIAALDNGFLGAFVRGWQSAGLPEIQAAIDAENHSKYEECLDRQLSQLNRSRNNKS